MTTFPEVNMLTESRGCHRETCLCADIIQSIKYPRGSHFPSSSIVIGRFIDIVERASSCSFYRLITRIWDHLSQLTVQSAGFAGPSKKHIDNVFVELLNDSDTPLTASGMRKWWTIDIYFFFNGKGNIPGTLVPFICSPKIALVADDVSLLNDIPESETPTVFEQVAKLRRGEEPLDDEFIKDALQRCTKGHGEKCSNPVRQTFEGKVFELVKTGRLDLPTRMRFVDLEKNCVSSAPSLCEYAVLSYVWGSSNFVTLTRKTISQFEATNSLRSMILPKTIAHAIEVTRSLGLRWLWVDSLCIVQDDSIDQRWLVGHMDAIYTNAVVTLVAAGSKEADHGLWHAGCQQIVEKCSGLRFVAIEPDVLSIINSSLWATRAWTYQEYVLSKRLLVFSGRQAYFMCEQFAFVEDLLHSIAADGSHHSREFDLSDETPGTPAFDLTHFPVYWRNLVSAFTKRTMTLHTDVVRSSSGVISAFCRGTKGDRPSHQTIDHVFCGLPISILFEYSLLWLHKGATARRGPNRKGNQFPSWSWAGWCGEVTYDDNEEVVQYAGQTILEWRVEDVVDNEVIYKSDWAKHLTTRRQNTLHETGLNVDIEKVREVLSEHEDGVLCFETLAAQLKLENEYSQQFLVSKDFGCTHTGVYRLCYDGRWIGGVHLHHEQARELLESVAAKYEVIVLSSTIQAWTLRDVKSFGPAVTDIDEDDTFSTSWDDSDDNDDEAYNVMLVVEDRDLVYRAGIGQVSRSQFDKIDPKRKLIRLA